MKRPVVPTELRDVQVPDFAMPERHSATRTRHMDGMATTKLRTHQQAMSDSADIVLAHRGMQGRPSKYVAEYDDLVETLHMAGLTIKSICAILSINHDTYYNWCANIPSFSASVIKGREIADAQVAKSLYHRACGYSHPAVDIKNIDGEIVVTEYVKHYPPDTAAAVYWLNNRQHRKWQNASTIDHTGLDNKAGVDATRPPTIVVNSVRKGEAV